jgi:acyl carrier protein
MSRLNIIDIVHIVEKHQKFDVEDKLGRRALPHDRLKEDLGIDSLALTSLLLELEEFYDIDIPDEACAKWINSLDVYDCIGRIIRSN